MIVRKDLVIAILATFCLTAVLFTAMPVSSSGKEFDPWLDYNDDGIIDLKDVYSMHQAYGTEGNSTRSVAIAGHATKLIKLAEGEVVSNTLPWWSGYIPVDGYSKASISIHMDPTNNNMLKVVWMSNSSAFGFAGDLAFNFHDFVKTYDIANNVLTFSVWHNEVYEAYIWVDVYLMA